MQAVKSYRDLKVWEKAMDLVVESYRVAERFPISISERLSHLRSNELEPILARTGELGRMLSGLTRSLKARKANTRHSAPGPQRLAPGT